MNEIKGFQNEYRWLSNFWYTPVVYDGIKYPTVENAYQAAKLAPDAEVLLEDGELVNAKQYFTQLKPSESKKFIRTFPLPPNWEKIKYEIMEGLLRQKFNIPKYKQKLLDTGDAYLEETNYWKDVDWGVCNGKGQNNLGRLIMKIREELRQ